jgi:endonuclease YncB( thermonuclease family)
LHALETGSPLSAPARRRPALWALRRPLVLCLLAALLVPTGARGEAFTGLVVGISDGDTLRVVRDGHAVKVRLYGVDAPEKGQAFGTAARQATAALAFQQTVTVEVRATDRWGRLVGAVRLPDGRNLSHELVRAGLVVSAVCAARHRAGAARSGRPGRGAWAVG